MEDVSPRRFTHRLSYWFINRTATVRVNGSIGASRTNKEGLLQGSVISPLLITIYIDDLMVEFEDDTLASTYADDLAIADSARNKDMIM